MKNEYEIRGDVTAIYLRKRDGTRVETLISTEKLYKAQEYPYAWCLSHNKETGFSYVIGRKHMFNGEKKFIKLHRWLTNTPNGMVTDHINHNTLDNTDSNLRIATLSENMQNRKGAMINSKSRVLGVSWHKFHDKWTAKFTVNKIRIHLGYFAEKEDAENAVREARKIYMPNSKEASA
jgi:hypothetical protein